MAIRNIRRAGDPILRKVSKEVKEMTPRLKELIADMFDTMYSVSGLGLSACQVGVLKRVFIASSQDEEGNYIDPLVLINPRFLETSGEQTGDEGCLSIPGRHGTVTRPNYVKVRAYDADFEPFELEATEMLARVLCHEADHLEGILYIDKVEGDLTDDEPEEEAGEESGEKSGEKQED